MIRMCNEIPRSALAGGVGIVTECHWQNQDSGYTRFGIYRSVPEPEHSCAFLDRSPALQYRLQ